MCILIHHTPETVFTDEVLRDFYDSNSDGFGACWGDGEKVHVLKHVGSVEDIITLYNDHVRGKECIIHFRMKTHGDIDYENCHPYHITDNLWLAHNGVLSTGNVADTTKSDTWHYIRNYLRPMVEKYGEDALFDPQIQAFLGSHIGTGNKFGIVHSDGRIAVINRSQGVNHFGAWLSNTYAWSTRKFGYGSAYESEHWTKKYLPATKSGYAYWDGEDYETYGFPANYKDYEGDPVGTVTHYQGLDDPYIADITEKAINCYNRGINNLRNWVYQAPAKAKAFIGYWMEEQDEEYLNELVDASPDEATEIIAYLIEDEFVSAV